MSVRRRTYRDPATGTTLTRWMVDVDYQHPDGRRERIRKVSPVQSLRGAEQYERDVRFGMLHPETQTAPAALAPVQPEQQEVPTLKKFAETFMKTYAKANNKASEQTSKRSILDQRLIPRIGDRRIDSFTALSIDELKADMLDDDYKPKTINNTLAVWSKLLHYAKDSEIISKVPPFKFMKVKDQKFDFFDFSEFERLVEAARREDEAEWEAFVLVGGESGLRMGEIIALKRDSIDIRAGNLTVWEASWHGVVGTPKGGDRRTVPMTARLKAALTRIRHLRGELVFCDMDGKPWTRNIIKAGLRRICRRAGLRVVGAHVLRHAFCSHLAMKGAAPKAIQELAGHKSLKVTMRYMHLTASALRDTIRLLESAPQTTPETAPSGTDLDSTAR